MLSKVMSMYDKTHYNIIKIKKKKSIPLASRNFSENTLSQPRDGKVIHNGDHVGVMIILKCIGGKMHWGTNIHIIYQRT